ncbi:MAG: glycoside hydrolase family 13 protein [Deinococcales bacterium]
MPGQPVDVPEWVQDAVFYQIFPDRFAQGADVPKPVGLEPWDTPPSVHGYKGGDLHGVAERLEHLQALGVTALYLNPVFQSASNHRYHTHDYHHVDPMLGGDQALRALLDAAHALDMRVVLDGVFNHASRGFLQFNDILENGEHSAYLDWFSVRRFPLNAYGGGELGYDAWWNLPALPKLNTATPAVREFLWDVGERWLAFGADGWRLDVPNEIDDAVFWREFRRRCRAVRPDCYLVGEIWEDAQRWLGGDQFDAVMNYPLTRAIYGFVGRALADSELARSGLRRIRPLDAAGFAEALEALLERYPREIVHAQLNLLGSHDTPRARTVLLEDDAALQVAYLLLFTLPGAPCIYYGDELGLTGGHDPGCRNSMPWDDPATWDRELLARLTRLAGLRRDHAALRRGDTKVLLADGTVLAYARTGGDERLLVVVNVGTEAAELPADAPLRGRFRELQSGESLELVPGTSRLPAQTGWLLQSGGD